MSTVKIKIGRHTVRAKLLEEEAPKTCRIVKKFSPLEGKLNHSKICDNEVFFKVPFFIDEMENQQTAQAGDIGFWNVRQTFCIWYDDMIPLVPINLSAKITDNLEGFKKEARNTWLSQGTKIRFEVVD